MQVLFGRITADAVINNVNEEKKVVNFSIALNHSYKSKEGERKEQTTFVNCAYWRNTGITSYLTKGTLVEVAGHLSVNAYTDLQGNARASLKFHTNEITFHGKAKAEQEAKEPVKKNRKKKSETAPQAAEVTEPIDDLPF